MGRRTGVCPDRPLAPVNVVRDALPVPLYPVPDAPTAAFGLIFFGASCAAVVSAGCTASTGSTFGSGGGVGVGAGGGVGCGCCRGDGLPID